MSRKAWILIARTALFVALIIVTVLILRYFFISDDDDRPPIIVTNGSMRFDDGDSSKPKKWKGWAKPDPSNAKRWTQAHPNGFDVASFTVTLAGSSDSTCPATPVTASAVTIDYTLTAGGTVSQVKVERLQVFSTPGHVKWEPWITAPTDMTMVLNPPTAPPAPSRIVYNPGDGYISNATLTTVSGPVSCPFSSAQRSSVSISIQPVK